MDAMARMTSKGQITVPKEVREALGLKPGDSVLFRVREDGAAAMAKGLAERLSRHQRPDQAPNR